MSLRFGNREDIELRDETTKTWRCNHCISVFGEGPQGSICFNCCFFYPGKEYGRCGLRGDEKTKLFAHNPEWPTCGKFSKIEMER